MNGRNPIEHKLLSSNQSIAPHSECGMPAGCWSMFCDIRRFPFSGSRVTKLGTATLYTLGANLMSLLRYDMSVLSEYGYSVLRGELSGEW